MNYLSSSTQHTTTQPIITTTTHQSSSLSSSPHPLPPLIKLKDFIRTGQGNFLEYLFWTDNTALGDISSRFSILVVFILILLIRKIKYRLIPFFSSIGKELAEKGRQNGKEWVRNPANQIRIEKFGEYCFRLIYHSLLSLYGVYFNFGHYLWSYYKQKEILFDNIQPEIEEEEEYYIWSWSLYPGEAIKPAIAWYFLIQFAYHLEALITQIMISFQASETRAGTGTANNNLNNNSNTPLSSSHNNSSNSSNSSSHRNSYYYNTLLYHLVANVVIFFYSNARFSKFGSFVILLHNISDVPVDLSKLANFMKWKRATVISIIILVFFWCYTRLLIMPSIVYRSVISLNNNIFQQKIMDTEKNAENTNNWYYNNNDDEQQIQQQQELVESRNFLFYYRLFCFFSVGITVIHFAWFIMFLKMSYVLVTNVKEIDVFEEEQEEYYEERKEDAGRGDDLLLSTTTREQEETLEDSERRKKDN